MGGNSARKVAKQIHARLKVGPGQGAEEADGEK